MKDTSNSSLARRQVSLVETLDRVLNKGAVVTGDLTISVADIDLLYLGLSLIVSSVETMEKLRCKRSAASFQPSGQG